MLKSGTKTFEYKGCLEWLEVVRKLRQVYEYFWYFYNIHQGWSRLKCCTSHICTTLGVDYKATHFVFNETMRVKDVLSLLTFFLLGLSRYHPSNYQSQLFIGWKLFTRIGFIFNQRWLLIVVILIIRHTSPLSSMIMVRRFGHWDAMWPNPWHLKHLVSRLHALEVSLAALVSLLVSSASVRNFEAPTEAPLKAFSSFLGK